MSTFSDCTLTASSSAETRVSGRQLALTLYRTNVNILLTGELGAGKTTFAQGFASGLGVEDRVVSPTYALEQRYQKFTHIDLYRLTEQQAKTFLAQSEGAEGIRLIEWADRTDLKTAGECVHVHIDDEDGTRKIRIRFLDEPVPEDTEIDEWIHAVRMPKHIQEHSRKVAEVADRFAKFLVESRGIVLRPQALHAAARVHDLLRFVDFKTWDGDEVYEKTPDEIQKIWSALKDRYGMPHEEAAGKFLEERGYGAIGQIVRCHRGMDKEGSVLARTIEEKVLAYSDKRVAFDRAVTLNERFEDFVRRYGNGRASDHHTLWLSTMKTIETELFPEGPPTL